MNLAKVVLHVAAAVAGSVIHWTGRTQMVYPFVRNEAEDRFERVYAANPGAGEYPLASIQAEANDILAQPVTNWGPVLFTLVSEDDVKQAAELEKRVKAARERDFKEAEDLRELSRQKQEEAAQLAGDLQADPIEAVRRRRKSQPKQEPTAQRPESGKRKVQAGGDAFARLEESLGGGDE